MKQETYVIEDDVLINTIASTERISIDHENNGESDPLTEPLIDVDELEKTIDNEEPCNQVNQKCLSVHSTTSIQTTRKFPHIIHRCRGIFYALFSSFIFTCSGFVIKKLHVDFFDALFGRFILQTVVLTSFIFFKKNKFIHGSNKLILLQIVRTITATSGIILFFSSYRYIPLPDLTTCRYTQVVWTAIIAMIIFRERISLSTVLAIIFTLTGVALVAQPTFLFNNPQIAPPRIIINSNKTAAIDLESDKSYRLLGLCLALACALSISFSMVLNKKLLVSKIPQSIIMLEFSVLTLSFLILNHIYNRFILHKYEHQTMFTWQFFAAAAVSLFQVLSSTITQRAIKLEHPSIVSVVQSSDILFAIILQNLFSKVKSNGFVLLGSLLVTTSIILVGAHKFWQDRKKFTEKTASRTKL